MDELFLPDVHPDVYESVAGQRRSNTGDALGVIETSSMAAVVRAADRALKTAASSWSRFGWVTVWEVRGSHWFPETLRKCRQRLKLASP